jgi:hypothetical protein
MMDDVLVNFDPVRARSTAATLAKFSQEAGVQILFFTCHPDTVDLFPVNLPTIDIGCLNQRCRESRPNGSCLEAVAFGAEEACRLPQSLETCSGLK